jgi:general secretion pathway protein A
MYEDFFGLEDEPFRLTPDPRYLFLSSKHAEALAHLRLGLTESSGFVCITGEVGSGKTTLVRSFLSELGAEVRTACIYVPPLSPADLLRRICGEFGIPAPVGDQSRLVEKLQEFLVAEQSAGRKCVLVVDEAQALSIELLEQIRLLLNLETPTQKLLRIVLVGQPQLRRLLLDPDLKQLNQRITLRWHLGRLSREETLDYVAHRLAVASGGRARRVFTRPALHLLHAVSEGVPRLVNMVAHRALLAAYVARDARVRRRFVARAYREIQSVPLPGTLSLARKAAWTVAGLAVGVTLFSFAAAPLDRFLAGITAPQAAPLDAVEPATVALRAGRRQRTPPAREIPPPPLETSAGAEIRVTSAADIARRLDGVGANASTRTAMEAILRAWGERPLADDELRSAVDLDTVARRRGLHELALTGNRSMLRLLDLPALVVLHTGSAGIRYAAVTSLEPAGVSLSIAGEPLNVSAAAFDRQWSGEARLFWRDFDRLGPLLRRGARGVSVVRLQKLLREVGVFSGVANGWFTADTETAVRRFQRRHLLPVDGLVGPLTQIVLYATAGGYGQPSLAHPAAPG